MPWFTSLRSALLSEVADVGNAGVMKNSVKDVTSIAICPSLGAELASAIMRSIERDYNDEPVHVEVTSSPSRLGRSGKPIVEIMPFPRNDGGFVARRIGLFKLGMFRLRDAAVMYARSRDLIITPEVTLSKQSREVLARETQHQSLVFVDGVEAALELARSLGARVIVAPWKFSESRGKDVWEPIETELGLPGGAIYLNRNFEFDESNRLYSLLIGVISRSLERNG